MTAVPLFYIIIQSSKSNRVSDANLLNFRSCDVYKEGKRWDPKYQNV